MTDPWHLVAGLVARHYPLDGKCHWCDRPAEPRQGHKVGCPYVRAVAELLIHEAQLDRRDADDVELATDISRARTGE